MAEPRPGNYRGPSVRPAVDLPGGVVSGGTPRPGATADEWLALQEASRLLGVHAATLRRWADQRAVPVFITPGGHRRFRRADVERFEQEHRQTEAAAEAPVSLGPEWANRAIAHTRQSVAGQQWLSHYDESERSTERHVGQRLIGLMLQFVSRPDEGAELLAEARGIGELYAQVGLQHGQSLIDLLEAVSFFRRTLIEVTVLQALEVTPAQAKANVHLLHRIEAFLNQVQAGIAGPYVDQS